MYIPLYSEGEQIYIYRCKFKKFAKLTVALPLAGFTICVLLSIIKDFESANYTHCNVVNVLPSVSAAIGSYYPQNIIWKACIAIHSPARFVIALLYYQHNSNIIPRRLRFWVLLIFLLNCLEISCLFGLSFWDSSENYPVHKTCFVTFVFSSQIYMLISCILLKWFKLLKPTEDEKFSIGLKWFLFWINFVGSISAAYFFARHNSHCEPMVYSLFAASEYVVILTNMAFHMMSCFDFGERDLFIRSTGIALAKL